MANIPGTNNDDILNGTPDNDTINGYNGNDTIAGLGGNDHIWGGAGNDSIDGGDGDDEIDGGTGRDTINGGAGNDTLRGGGDSSGDVMDGGAGDDRIFADNGNDTILGDIGNDSISANNGDDLIDAGAGNDTVHAGEGNDTAEGGAGADSIVGGNGNDVIWGDASVAGGADDGNDTLEGNDGADIIHGGGGNDNIDGGTGADQLFGDAGNDLIHGRDDHDVIDGGEGDDQLFGDGGNDTLTGGVGNDTMNGGDGRDDLSGGDGNDLLDGGAAADTLTGGMGYDTFIAGTGDLITDFNAGAEANTADGDPSNNDLVDLSDYYNDSRLAQYNAAMGTSYKTPLEWMRADQDDDGILNGHVQSGLSNFTMTIQNGGSSVAGAGLTVENTRVYCFAADAMIETANGPVAAGDLQVGDMVRTRDHGMQPLRWIGKRVLEAAELAALPHIRPIRICKGALGKNSPTADLVVSPQHRMLIRSRIAQRMFGATEILAAAKQLLLVDGIDIASDLQTVTYVHFMFDAHEIVFANGAESESMHTGAEAMTSVGPQLREEIFTIFPELREGAAREPARMLASGRMARKLVVRHRRNERPLVN